MMVTRDSWTIQFLDLGYLSTYFFLTCIVLFIGRNKKENKSEHFNKIKMNKTQKKNFDLFEWFEVSIEHKICYCWLKCELRWTLEADPFSLFSVYPSLSRYSRREKCVENKNEKYISCCLVNGVVNIRIRFRGLLFQVEIDTTLNSLWWMHWTE